MTTTLSLIEPPSLPITDEPIIVDELVLDDGSIFGKFALCHIRISSTNRKRFSAEKLQQLADSAREKGIVQPILIRPVEATNEAPQQYEIIAGERRYRASIMAGLTRIPAICRVMSDHDAIELQILENLQREDPHPLEEAEGYERLMLTHGYSADQLAERLKKSRSYIYGRLKLCALALDLREPFLNDQINASTALLIARIPVPKLQARAFEEILKPQWGGEPMSYRAAAQHVQNRYTLTLASAEFDIKDSKLLAAAGACSGCPKRTGNQPVLYPDVDANICTDPECFAEKRAAHQAKIVVMANKKGVPVLEGREATEALGDLKSVFAYFSLWKLDRLAPGVNQNVTITSVLSEKQLPAVKAIVKLDNGVVHTVYDKAAVQAAAEAAGICMTREAWDEAQAAKNSSPAAQERAEAERQRAAAHDEKVRRAEALTAERVTLYRKVRARAGAGLSLCSQRELAKFLLREFGLPFDLLGETYAFSGQDDAAAEAYLDQATQGEVQMILLDLLLTRDLEVNHWSLQQAEEDDDETLSTIRAIAQHEGIDVNQVERDSTSIDPVALQDKESLCAYIAANADRLNDLTPLVIKDAPHLVKTLDVAGHETGYVWRDNEWHAPEAPAAPSETSPVDLVEQKPEPAPRKTLSIKPRASTEPGATAEGPVIKMKKPARTVVVPALAYTAPDTPENSIE